MPNAEPIADRDQQRREHLVAKYARQDGVEMPAEVVAVIAALACHDAAVRPYTRHVVAMSRKRGEPITGTFAYSILRAL